jgi:hypothetical protein
MRTILMGLGAMGVGAVAMLAASASSAVAANARWCSTGSIGSVSATRCDFHTFAQCVATVRGVGGSCIENPEYAWARRYGNQRRGDQRYRDNWQWR